MPNVDKTHLPRHLVDELSKVHWLEPWWGFYKENPTHGSAFEQELRNEVCETHVLWPYRKSARAVAKRGDCDDCLFWLPEAEQSVAIVHLTWKSGRESDSYFPRTSLLKSFTDFVELEMIPDNREWLCGTES